MLYCSNGVFINRGEILTQLKQLSDGVASIRQDIDVLKRWGSFQCPTDADYMKEECVAAIQYTISAITLLAHDISKSNAMQ